MPKFNFYNERMQKVTGPASYKDLDTAIETAGHWNKDFPGYPTRIFMVAEKDNNSNCRSLELDRPYKGPTETKYGRPKKL